METISQRDMRNDNAEIMRAVEAGESFTVTRRGVPVARLVPFDDQPDLPCVRHGTPDTAYAQWDRVTSEKPTSEILDDLRGDR